MAILDGGRHDRIHHDHRSEEREASLLFLFAYPFCLAAAIAQRLAPRGLKPATQSARKSVFSEAKADARSIIPFAFR